MKKTIQSLFALAVAAFAFTACSDVPEPEGYNSKTGDGLVTYVAEGTGTATDPYNVAGIVDATKDLNKGETTTIDIYAKGYVSEVTDFNASYGNISYSITDNAEGKSKKFIVYRGMALGNTKFAAKEDLKVGDEVIICGKVTNYNGTIEYAQGNYLVSLNGKTSGGGETTPGEAEGDGSEANPFNVAAAVAKCKEVGETASTDKFYIKGIAKADYTVDSYHNITVDIVDTESSSETFTIYRCKDADNKGIKEGFKITKGDVIIVYGPIVNYKGNTPETATGAYVVSVNGNAPEVEGGSSTGGGQSTANHGTAEAPLTVAQAIAVIDAESTASNCYVKGIICQIDSYNSTYKSITYWISDDGGTTTKLQVYSGKGLNGADFAAKEDLTVGKTVVINGTLKKYNSTYEFDKTSSIISIE